MIESIDGTLDARVTTQFWFDAGEGQVTVNSQWYIGSTLVDSCVVSMDATIQRR